MGYRIGIDIGGTFTDIVLLGEGGVTLTAKVPSTPADYSRAIGEGIRALFDQHGIAGADIEQVMHGTTIATNAILEKKGAKTALITTEGFGDVLEIRRLRMPVLYDLGWRKPEALVERGLRFEVRERINHRGEVERALDEVHAAQVVDEVLGAGVDAIAVCLLNAYASGEHERRILALIRGRDPDISVCLSCEILPEIKEYERTSTTVVNAYIQPVVQHYLRALSVRLRELGVSAPVLVMQSNGGAMGVESACARPIHIIESGPAAGVVGAAEIITRVGHLDALTFDMGGTTAKASMIEGGRFNRSGELDVGAGINLSGRMLNGGGYHVRVPAIDIAEVGAGGGSLVEFDAGGGLKVGPQSAGAQPGPVCYGLGNEVPTVTDANLALGYLNPSYLVGGELALDHELACAALRDRVAGRLGVSLEEAAYGVHVVANSTMARALRAVSSERGRDPRKFVLVAFGGSGPVHAASLSASLDIARILVPPVSGVFSALGLLFPPTEHHYVQTYKRDLDGLDRPALESLYGRQQAQAQAELEAEGFPASRIAYTRLVDMRYSGENSELTLPVPATDDLVEALREAFDREHEIAYGYRSRDERVEIVNVRIIATGLSDAPRVPDQLSLPAARAGERGAGAGERRAYFGRSLGWLSTPVIGREAIDDTARAGPLIIEEYDCTTVVPPEWRVRKGNWDILIMDRGSS